MNKRIKELAIQSGAWDHYEINEGVDGDEKPLEKFAELIVYDFLSELTNDDALGEARIVTIKRLAEKWGINK